MACITTLYFLLQITDIDLQLALQEWDNQEEKLPYNKGSEINNSNPEVSYFVLHIIMLKKSY